MRKRRGGFDRVLEYSAVAAAEAALGRAALPGIARFAATPVLLRIVRNRKARNVLLGLAAAGLVLSLLSDWSGRDDEEEWDEPY
jgi:hypothetical protein